MKAPAFEAVWDAEIKLAMEFDPGLIDLYPAEALRLGLDKSAKHGS